MNLYQKFTTNELKKLQEIGIDIQNKEYSHEKIRQYAVSIEDYIMSKSSKNGDIGRAIEKYSGIINKINEIEYNKNIVWNFDRIVKWAIRWLFYEKMS